MQGQKYLRMKTNGVHGFFKFFVEKNVKNNKIKLLLIGTYDYKTQFELEWKNKLGYLV